MAGSIDDGEGEEEEPTPLRVLVVDDVEANAIGLTLLLEIWGHQVATALSGSAALGLVAESPFDAAIIDLGMPDMDGFELAERLRQQVSSELLVVSLSGYGDEETQQRAKAVGIDHHLTKPADVTQLKALLAQAVRRG